MIKRSNKIHCSGTCERESCRNQSKKYRGPLIKVPFLIDMREDSRPPGYCYIYRIYRARTLSINVDRRD